MGKNGTTAVADVQAETTGKKAREARVAIEQPYSVEVVIEGVESKGKAAKGSAQKKTDNLESYVYRCPDSGEIGVPGKNMKACLVEASRSVQDPRSPRKSARDLVRASLFVTPEVASLGKKTWDFEDKQPVIIQRSRVTRIRPGFVKGWRLTFIINVIQPAYVSPELLEKIVGNAGSFSGLGDFRPDYGRFKVVKFVVRDFCDVQ